MKIECTLKTEKNSSIVEEIKVESDLLLTHEKIKLIVGTNEVVVNANELIKAINNCINY